MSTTESRRPAPRARANRTTRSQRLRAERNRDRRHRLLRTQRIALAVLLSAVIVAVAVLLSGGKSATKHHAAGPRRPTVAGANLANPDLVGTYIGAASSDIAAVTTYDYRRLDDALNAGLAVTTGTYREAYRTALTGELAQTAIAEHVVHDFEVLDVGIGEMNARGTQAKVLVFGQERITDDATGPDASVSPITLCATIVRMGDRFLISDLVDGANAGLPPGGPDLPVAAEAARSEVVNLLSYTRVDFPSDLQRALAGSTTPLRQEIRRNAAATEAAMNGGHYDTSGVVTAIGVVRADTDTVTLLVAANASQLADGATTPSVTPRQYEVTVTRTAQGWAASRVSSVDGGS